LAPACDGVVFVSDVRRTTRSNVARAREQLDRTRSLVLGAVVLDPARGEPSTPTAYGSSDWSRSAAKKALAAPKDPLNGRRAAGEEIPS
jgi:Mrp family chromosome partitioning ATPase